MNSARTMPWVLVLPPRSNLPGFQSPLICALKVSMIDWVRLLRSAGIRSSASFRPSFGRCQLINAVVRRASGSRSSASKGGRIQGSMRRWSCISRSDVSLIQLRSAEPVSAGGTGRLVDRTQHVSLHHDPLSAHGREVAQRADAGQEEVGAAPYGDELRQAAQTAVRTAGLRNREAVGRKNSRRRASGGRRSDRFRR